MFCYCLLLSSSFKPHSHLLAKSSSAFAYESNHTHMYMRTHTHITYSYWITNLIDTTLNLSSVLLTFNCKDTRKSPVYRVGIPKYQFNTIGICFVDIELSIIIDILNVKLSYLLNTDSNWFSPV